MPLSKCCLGFLESTGLAYLLEILCPFSAREDMLELEIGIKQAAEKEEMNQSNISISSGKHRIDSRHTGKIWPRSNRQKNSHEQR